MDSCDRRTVYDRCFWLAYGANGCAVTAFALHFRFADFVDFLGGNATAMGLIWGVGMLGSLVARVVIGYQADQRGLRWPWILTAALFFGASLGFLFVERVGPLIYALRVLFSVALAGMFCCTVAFVWRGVPVSRRAEAVGLMGTSGFVGMLLGPQLADFVFRLPVSDWLHYKLLFGLATLLAAVELVIVLVAVAQPSAAWAVREPAEGLFTVVRRYAPWNVLPATLVMGASQAVIFTFLTRYVAARGLSGIGPFFAVYATWALCARVLGRRVPERFGLERSILVAIALHMVTGSLFALADSWSDFLLVAFVGGTAHAILFPCVTALGAGRFPAHHMVTGIAVTLSLVDLSNFVMAPSLGWLIDQLGFEAMFAAYVVLAGTAFVTFALVSLRQPSAAGSRLRSALRFGAERLAGVTWRNRRPQTIELDQEAPSNAPRKTHFGG